MSLKAALGKTPACLPQTPALPSVTWVRKCSPVSDACNEGLALPRRDVWAGFGVKASMGGEARAVKNFLSPRCHPCTPSLPVCARPPLTLTEAVEPVWVLTPTRGRLYRVSPAASMDRVCEGKRNLSPTYSQKLFLNDILFCVCTCVC